MQNESYDILITGGLLLTMSNDMEIIDDSVIGIIDGRIALIGRQSRNVNNLLIAEERLDATGMLIMPGLVNTHTHLPMVCFRGMADDLPLMEWLQNNIWPAEAKYVNREMVYAGAMLGIAEMILSGTTTFCDAYFYESSVARAASDAGIRGVVCQGFIDIPKQNNPEEIAGIAEKFIDRWIDKYPMIIPAVACHAPYSCTPENLIRIKEVARRRDVSYNIHVSETKEEVSLIKKRYGKTPFAFLKDIDVLDQQTITVHCNWLDEEEMEIMTEFGVKMSHNPESSLKLAAGLAPVPELLKRGVVIGFGTDGTASNNNLDLFGEMATAAKIHKFAEMDPTVMDAKTVLKMATKNSARVLGLERYIGSIEVGKCADIIILDMNQPHWVPLYNPYSQLVYAASGADVMISIIGGKIVMRDRKLLTIDLPSVMSEVNNIAKFIANA